MSTKIYYGVRFPRSRLPEFTIEARVRGLNAVFKAAKILCETVKDLYSDDYEKVVERHGHKATDEPPGKCCAVSATIDVIGTKYHGHQLLDLSYSWSVWLPEKSTYALAVPRRNHTLDHAMPRWVRPYGYWDNTDRPKSVTVREWRSRRKAWSVATAPTYESHSLTLHVFDSSRFSLDMSWLYIRLTEGRLKPGRPRPE